MQGYCLTSQDIRKRIEKGVITVKKLNEDQIQPASFEPTLGDEAWEINTDRGRVLSPRKDTTMQHVLDDLPAKHKKLHSIKKGFELKRHHTYIIPLNETIKLRKNDVITSSPKSSVGRVFPKMRLMADFNPCFDEMHADYKEGVHLRMYLLLEPQAFDLIVYPGLQLNQLRFHVGNSRLSDDEIKELNKKEPLLYSNAFYDNPSAVKTPIVYDGLQLHLDLLGEHCGGLVGLRARHVSTPIDLSKKNFYNVDDFFDRLKSREEIVVRPGEFFLFLSKEILHTPEKYNFELKDHSHIGLMGPLHFAGFVDNGFVGDLVFEVRSEEFHDLVLQDGMPLSRIHVFRTRTTPDKLYGESIGSHYHKQKGPRPAKYFKSL